LKVTLQTDASNILARIDGGAKCTAMRTPINASGNVFNFQVRGWSQVNILFDLQVPGWFHVGPSELRTLCCALN
jgi:hypothetical protein